MAHGEVYVAQTTPAHTNHFYRSIIEANAYPGPAVIVAYSACMPEHGIADDAATRQAKLAVDCAPSRCSPTTRVGGRRCGSALASKATRPCGGLVDATGRKPRRLPRVRADRGPVRTALPADGGTSDEILATQADRLANWRSLQEMAGLLAAQATSPAA